MAEINKRLRSGCRIKRSRGNEVKILGRFHVVDTGKEWNNVIDWGIDNLRTYLKSVIKGLPAKLMTYYEWKKITSTNETLVKYTGYRVHKSLPSEVRTLGKFFIRDEGNSRVVRHGLKFDDLYKIGSLVRHFDEEATLVAAVIKRHKLKGKVAIDIEVLLRTAAFSKVETIVKDFVACESWW